MCVRKSKVDDRNYPQSFFHFIHRGRGSQSNSERIDISSLTRQLALRIPCLCFLMLELQVRSACTEIIPGI